MYIRQVLPRAYFLSRQDDVIASCLFVFYCCEMRKFSKTTLLFELYIILTTLLGQRRGTCGHAMALFDSHTNCAHCREKGMGSDACVEKKPCSICDGFSEEQKLQLSTPKYRVRKELQKKTDYPSHVNPSDVTALGKVESKGETSSDRGKTPSKKSKKISHKSPLKKPGKSTDFQTELHTLDEKWSERFSRLEALFLSKSFTVPVEPVQSSDVVVTERPFIPPTRQTAPSSPSQQQSTSQKKGKKATQPVEAPSALPGSQQMELSGDVLAIRPIEAPSADQDASLPANLHRPGSRSYLQFPVPASKHSVTSTGPTVPVEEPTPETGNLSDHSSSAADEGEVSDLDSTGQDQEELLEGDQELLQGNSARC